MKRPPRSRRQQHTGTQQRRETRTGRGVSDAIGFTLMFAIIILGAGLISLAGGSQIATLSEVEEVRSAERGMESMAATLEPMASQGDPQRGFSLAFSNSNIWMNQTTLNVTTRDGWDKYENLQVNALEQRFDREDGPISVRYEAGGVFKTNAVPAYEPTFTCKKGATDTAIITVVNLTLDEQEGLYVSHGYDPNLRFNEFAGTENPPVASTDEAVSFEAHLVESERNLTNDVTIVVNTRQTAGQEQWRLYFDDHEGWTEVDDHVYECASDRAIVRVVTIELSVVEPRFAD
jgi:hypothetical protein